MEIFLELFTKLREEGYNPRFIEQYDEFADGVVIKGDHFELINNLLQFINWNKAGWVTCKKKTFKEKEYTFINLEHVEAMLHMKDIFIELDTGFNGEEWEKILNKMRKSNLLSTEHEVHRQWKVKIQIEDLPEKLDSDGDLPF